MKVKLFITALFFLLAGFGCSQRALLTTSDTITQDPISKELAELSQTREALDRMMIYEADLKLTIEKSQSEKIHQTISRIAKAEGGFLLSMQKHRSKIRVPSEKLDATISAISELGELVDKDIRGQDITEEFQDLQVRLDSAEKTRLRYLELLAIASGVKQALAIEKELERINVTIERLKGRINRLEHLDYYATITVDTSEKTKPGPLGYLALGVVKAVGKLFVWN
ncbi:MAG: DUF4349 domain-containing protein [Calditrichota bacterium]